MGSVHTGTEHPLRKDISQPSAPVPTSSNIVGTAADRHPEHPLKGTDTSASSMHRSSQLHEVTGGDPSKAD
ncbi:hypothetical protein LZ31DRAFT_549330 [Colletotrichum somersetense]|nr:hypothetical protein LZ31DRAFT_549330 [Colletotrichum somersetense]